MKGKLFLAIVLVLGMFVYGVGADFNSLEYTLNSYTYGMDYEANVWDCSDMSISVAYFLQEHCGYDTVVVYNYSQEHAWVYVYGLNVAIETTADPTNKLGVIVSDSRYYGNHYVCEWDDCWQIEGFDSRP